MNNKTDRHLRHGERGQTIALVALSIVSLLAIAALAIDVVTLYSARGEAQRAADAAALAGAKAFVDSGVTAYAAGDPNLSAAQTLATTMANGYVAASLQQNKVSGAAPTLVGSAASLDFTNPSNPRITVNLQRTSLPTFFAKIWVIGRSSATVTATAMAEAYNATGNTAPIRLTGVKPLLIPNTEPVGTGKFINTTTGAVDTSMIGQNPPPIKPTSFCTGGGHGTQPSCTWPTGSPSLAGQYVPGEVTSGSNNLCPSCLSGSQPFLHSLECADTATEYSCGTSVTVPSASYRNWSVSHGLKCAIQQNIGANDVLASTSHPPGGPWEITANSGPLNGQLVTTSPSIMTFPIFDDSSLGTSLTIVGFLQVFLNGVDTSGPSTPSGKLDFTIMNVIGCKNSMGTGTPISADSVSPIPVRLIHH